MATVFKNNRIEPLGNKAQRYGNALDAEKPDDLITKKQLSNFLNGKLVEINGAFTQVDPNRAIKISTPSGDIYLAILIYP